ncbi:MAG: class I SAM-dependent methyltransferase [Spirochaetia bacterium]|nr:class I SAM-dependent methyltransferase [Spirochaetia bacterium]
MIYQLHGKQIKKSDLVKYVTNYKKSIESSKKNRYFQIIKNIPSGFNILDYGCGWGCFSKMMHDKGNNVVGIDLSLNEINICKTVWGENEKLKFKKSSIEQIKTKSFDFITSIQVIEHTHNPGNYLNQCNRVLKQDGVLVISIPNIMTPRFILPLLQINLQKKLLNLSNKINKEYQKSQDHIQAWDSVHFVKLVSTMGFTLEKYIPLEGIQFPIPNLVSKIIPSYFHFSLLKNYYYSMAFFFKKISDSKIKCND